MKTIRLGIALSILMMLPISAAPSEQLLVENNGTVLVDPLMGSVTWTGSILLKHRGRSYDVEGRATLYSGPSIQRILSEDPSIRRAKFVLKHEWISLVALGDIIITCRGGKMVKANRLVCIADGDEVLADGVTLAEDKK